MTKKKPKKLKFIQYGYTNTKYLKEMEVNVNLWPEKFKGHYTKVKKTVEEV